MAPRSKHKTHPVRPALVKGGVTALVVSIGTGLAALGITWPRLQTLADIQSISAADAAHKQQDERINAGLKELKNAIDDNNRAQTQQLNLILEAVLKR